MRSETFRTIIYSDESKFEKTEGRIQLREYKENLIFYNPFDTTINASYGAGNKIAVPTSSNYELMNFGVFAQHLFTQTSVKYSYENFTTLTEEGTVQFRVRTDFANGYGYQEFLATSVSSVTAGTYSFNLSVNEQTPFVVSIELDGTEDFTDIFNAIAIELPPSTGASCAVINNKIRISSFDANESILITEASDLSLITLLGGVDVAKLPNPPSTETTFFQIKNSSNNNNRIDIIHSTSGNLILKMYDNTGVLKVNKDFGIWDVNYLNWYAFELSWNKNFAQVFIDGQILDFALTGFTRGVSGDLIVSGSANNAYKFDELIVYNKHINFVNYTPSLFALTKYATDNPYIDIFFGNGLTQEALTSVSVLCSNNCHFVVKLGTQFYYFLTDVWSFSDGSFSQSMTKNVFTENIQSLYLNSNLEFSIRVFFESDGATSCYLDEIVLEESSSVNTTAKVIGVMSLKYPVDLSTGNDKFIIRTDQGVKEVSVITHCLDTSAVTLEEVKAAINAAEVPGLRPAGDDGSYHLVLETETTGSTAYISVERI